MRTNSAHQRDTRYLIHQQTNLDDYARDGGVLMARGDGVYRDRRPGQPLSRGDGRDVVRLARLQREAARRAAADKQSARAALLPHVQSRPHAEHRSRGEADRDRAEGRRRRAARSRAAAVLGFEANGHGDQADLVLFQCDRPPAEEEDHQADSAAITATRSSTVSLSGQPHMHRDFDLPLGDRFLHTEDPHYYRFAEPGESEEAFAEAPRASSSRR